MKRRLISMAVLMVMILGCMTGCGAEKNSDKTEDAIDAMSDETLEAAIVDKVEELEATDEIFAEESTEAVDEPLQELKEVIYEPSQEIIDADFSSLLIQLNNDVFQQGGYMTVAELVEQYGDRYEFTYKDGTYEERKDYLLEYYEGDHYEGGIFYISSHNYYIDLTPTYGDSRYGIRAYIANLTSPDEKVTLDKAYVLEFDTSLEYAADGIFAPEWIPNGFLANGFLTNGIELNNSELDSQNDNYTKPDFVSFIESKGFTNYSNPLAKLSELEMTYDYGVYNEDRISFYFAGEPNTTGLRPLFGCTFYFNSDTDKLKCVAYEFKDFIE